MLNTGLHKQRRTMENKDYLELFHTDLQSLERLMGEARACGAGYVDFYFECTGSMNLTIKDSVVSSGGCHEDFGVGIRVVEGEKTGYAYCETTDYQAMKQALRAALAIRGSGETIANMPIARQILPHKSAGTELLVLNWMDADLNALAGILKSIDLSIRHREPRTANVIGQLNGKVSRIMMYNSFGELCCEERPLGSIALSAVFAGKNGRNINTSASLSYRSGVEMLDGNLPNILTDKLTADLDEKFEAIRPKGGSMPVVMGAGASGILLHEAMGHAFEADFNRKGQSIFSESMGKRICPEGITIIDDGTIPLNRGSNLYDDEGVVSQKTVLVENGILTSYMHDRISASYYGVSPTGNGRRENFRNNPIPRMRATYMDSGKYTGEEIIASVKYGLYVDEFSNGQVNIGEGDFTFYVRSGHLIENGRLTTPVKDINIIGNGPEALGRISMVANDLKIDNGAWTCGKDQSVPVSVGIPTVRIDSLAVGGE